MLKSIELRFLKIAFQVAAGDTTVGSRPINVLYNPNSELTPTWAMFPEAISRRLFDDLFGNSKIDWSAKFLKNYKKIQNAMLEQKK